MHPNSESKLRRSYFHPLRGERFKRPLASFQNDNAFAVKRENRVTQLRMPSPRSPDDSAGQMPPEKGPLYGGSGTGRFGVKRSSRNPAHRTRSGALFLLRATLIFALHCAVLPAGAAPHDAARFESRMRPFLDAHCVECHGSENPKAKLDLKSLSTDTASRETAAVWAAVLRKVSSGEMPPEDEPRPEEARRRQVLDSIRSELIHAGHPTLSRHEGSNGNILEHQLLFGTESTAPFRIPPRLRRLGPHQYESFTKTITIGPGGILTPGINLPFIPDSRAIFSDFGAPPLDEPTTGQLLRTALFLVEQQTGFEIKDGVFTPLRRGAWIPGAAAPSGAQMPTEFRKLMDASQQIGDADLAAAVAAQFRLILQRPPTVGEAERFTAFMKKCVADSGRVIGGRHALAAVLLLPEAVYRLEMGGAPAQDGRVRLTPREIASGIARALTDRPPEPWLLTAADAGHLDTREGVEAAIRTILEDSRETWYPSALKGTHVKAPLLRFIREFFGYPRAVVVFKDGLDPLGRGLRGNPDHSGKSLVEDADRLVGSILERDKQVLCELLTTNKAFVSASNAELAKKQRPLTLARLEEMQAREPEKYRKRFGEVRPADLPAARIHKEGGVDLFFQGYGLTDFPQTQPAELPASERLGLLTHPAWLVAWSGNAENHVIFRGKWIREHLLGGLVPEVPITVDAVLPTDADKTLRERMQVTQRDYCWQCHRLMDPLGLPFEQYDHWGRYRSLDLGKPVDVAGGIHYAGDAALEGAVGDPFALIRRLADSPHVEQVFVRHAFRFFLGRNEELSDAPALRAAWQAYRERDGSLQKLVASLLASDSFLFRVPPESGPERPSPPRQDP